MGWGGSVALRQPAGRLATAWAYDAHRACRREWRNLGARDCRLSDIREKREREEEEK